MISSSEADPLTAPCAPGADNRASDLCAQWKAADAARLSAIWTRLAGLLAILGLAIGSGTLLAAIAAARYAREAARQAKRAADVADTANSDARLATERMLAENRRAIRVETLPLLTLQRSFDGMNIDWPWSSPEQAGTGTAYEGGPAELTLRLKNHGKGPALEVQIVFELPEEENPLSMPAPYSALGLALMATPAMPDHPQTTSLMTASSGIPIYRRWTESMPLCGPGETIPLRIPHFLLLRLFVVGLQPVVGYTALNEQRSLTVTLRFSSMENEEFVETFEFKVNPFSHGPTHNPPSIRVHAHWHDVPRFDRPKPEPVC